MITSPHTIIAGCFQDAWVNAVRWLSDNHWEYQNLVVQVTDPSVLREDSHASITTFARSAGLSSPRNVAYTIFPHGLYRRFTTAQSLFHAYNRPNGMYDRLYGHRRSWGTYFRRMTCYGGQINQLGNVIRAIRARSQINRGAYTVLIAVPGGETTRPRGGPCLNYIAVQIDGPTRELGLLAVYRNHDFLERAYGNYWGLCNLLRFLSEQSGCNTGPLTCVSSRAYVDDHRTLLLSCVDAL